MVDRFSMLAVIILVISTLILLLSQNWRLSIAALAIQYLAVFGLTMLVWPLGLSAAKLVAGWMATAVLGSSQPGMHLKEDAPLRGSIFLFRVFLAMLVWILVIALTLIVIGIISVPLPLAIGAMLLIGMGLIQLGISTRPLRVLFGLLTALAGFELIYAAVERAVLVTGLMAAVTLGLAFIGAYLFEVLSDKQEVG